MDIHLFVNHDQITKDNSPIPLLGIGEYLSLIVLSILQMENDPTYNTAYSDSIEEVHC